MNASPTEYALSPVEVSENIASGIARKLKPAIIPKNFVSNPILKITTKLFKVHSCSLVFSTYLSQIHSVWVGINQ